MGSFAALWVDPCPTVAIPGAFAPWVFWMAEAELLSAVHWPQTQGNFVEPESLHTGHPESCWSPELQGMHLSFLALLCCCAQLLEPPALQLQLQWPSHHLHINASSISSSQCLLQVISKTYIKKSNSQKVLCYIAACFLTL